MIKKVFKPFRDAGRGICLACSGKNMRIELMATGWVFLLIWTAGYGAFYYIAAALTCGLVLSAECLNTALEKLCDRVTNENDEAIRAVKDIAAGAVLVSAVVALIVALFMFIDLEFWQAVLNSILDNKGWAAVALVVLPAGAVLTLLPPRKGKSEL